MSDRSLGMPVLDADNHLYETREALTKFLPDRYRGVIDYVDLRGRTKIVVRGRISEFIPNPTFDVVARPGVQEDDYRRGNPEGRSQRVTVPRTQGGCHRERELVRGAATQAHGRDLQEDATGLRRGPGHGGEAAVHIGPFWEEDLAELAGVLGVDRVLFGSDYPHPEGLGDPVTYAEELQGLDDDAVRKIMGGKLARLTNMDAAVPA